VIYEGHVVRAERLEVNPTGFWVLGLIISVASAAQNPAEKFVIRFFSNEMPGANRIESYLVL
jgi:hypothetical protein